METVGLSHLSRDKLGHIHSDAYSIIQIEIQELNIKEIIYVMQLIVKV